MKTKVLQSDTTKSPDRQVSGVEIVLLAFRGRYEAAGDLAGASGKKTLAANLYSQEINRLELLNMAEKAAELKKKKDLRG